MRLVNVPEKEFRDLPDLNQKRKDEELEQEKKKEKFDPEKHWLFTGGKENLPWRKKELMEMLRGQDYYQSGNKIVVATSTPGMRMEISPNGENLQAQLKNDRGSVKAELSSFDRPDTLKNFMDTHDVDAPNVFSKKHSRLEDPHKHKGLAREI